MMIERPAAEEDAGDIERAFERIFGIRPMIRGEAPGRVNLLGEHTDYNDGFVLPVPLPYVTRVYASPAPHNIEAYAESFGEKLSGHPGDDRRGDWMDYVLGCVTALRAAGAEIGGAVFYIRRGVPVGAGLASSAALEIAILRALRSLHHLALDDLQLALIAHRAEVEHVGVRCGVMDQITASVGVPGAALLLDTRTLRYETVCVPAGCRFAVVDSGVPRRLAGAGYNQRRAECEEAAARLGVQALRDIAPSDMDRIMALPGPLSRRARHVVTENARVLDGVAALRRADLEQFGRLMLESHRSLREDYEVSIPELDRLVDLAMRHGALGARLTGAGFGGCIVALIPDPSLAAFRDGISNAYPGAKFY